MNLSRLQRRDRLALAWGAALVVPAVCYALVLQPYLSTLQGSRERLVEQRGLLARELALLDGAQRYPARMREMQVALGREGPRLFSGVDALSATSALTYYVSDRARRSRVVVQRVESDTPEASSRGLLLLRLNVGAEGDLEGILSFLRAIENGDKLVRVERLSIERARSYGESEDEALTFSATITGYAVAAAGDSAIVTRLAQAAP